MHITRKGTYVLGCGETTYRQKNFKSLESNYSNYRAGHTKHQVQQARTLFIHNTWKRFKHCVTKVFCQHKEEKGHVPYASLTRLDRLSIGEDELKRAQKKVRFCLRRKCSIDNELSVEREDELDRHFDTVLRERASRSRSYTSRRMAICTEIERNTEGNNGVSLFELRKTLIINNRFKEMGMWLYYSLLFQPSCLMRQRFSRLIRGTIHIIDKRSRMSDDKKTVTDVHIR